jgi:hypothetical protein
MQNIKPCWWGSHIWQTIFCIVAVYPDRPSSSEIEAIKNFLGSLKMLLPCQSCKKSYSEYILEPDTNINDISNFSSRERLIKFIYNLRLKVNRKLEQDYGITFNYFKKKLDSMICKESNNNIDSYIFNMIEIPCIPKELEEKVILYLKKKSGFDTNYTRKIINVCKRFMENPHFSIDDKYFKLVFKRNNKARKIIDRIYFNMSKDGYSISESFKRDSDLHQKLFYLGGSIIPFDELSKLV